VVVLGKRTAVSELAGLCGSPPGAGLAPGEDPQKEYLDDE